jgi:hypothetical protein
MSNSIQTDEHIDSLQNRILSAGLRMGRAFKRHCSALRYNALLADLDVIRAEAHKRLAPRWEDINRA